MQAADWRQRCLPYGYPLGPAEGNLYTDYTFTGQKSDATGLMFYASRYYDPYLNRFAQPDSITPDVYNPQSLNRYAYVDSVGKKLLIGMQK